MLRTLGPTSIRHVQHPYRHRAIIALIGLELIALAVAEAEVTEVAVEAAELLDWGKFKSSRGLLSAPSHANKQKAPHEIVRGFFCGNSWNRTNDTSIFSAVLYQLSYVAVSPATPFRLLWGPQRYERKTMTQEMQ